LSKWYYGFWTYPDIYVDDNYLLYMQVIHQLIKEAVDDKIVDLEATLFMITHKPALVVYDYEYSARPTEVEALYNLFDQAMEAELLRLKDG
jgi:hypothetical protein